MAKSTRPHEENTGWGYRELWWAAQEQARWRQWAAEARLAHGLPSRPGRIRPRLIGALITQLNRWWGRPRADVVPRCAEQDAQYDHQTRSGIDLLQPVEADLTVPAESRASGGLSLRRG